MTRGSPIRRTLAVAAFALTAVLAIGPALARAHGGGGEMAASEEAEIELLAAQPARVLAQQALALVVERGDAEEAAIRLDAALESSDQDDIDSALLADATEILDEGDPEGAIPVLDEALSRPLGSDRGKALHEAGREFSPGTGAQEVVAIVAGALLALVGVIALLRPRRRPAAEPSGS